MIIACTGQDCPNVIEVAGLVSSSASFTCRRHTTPSRDDVRFQRYQFDDRLVGTGTDPRAYETQPHSKKAPRKFPKIGRPRKKRLEKLEASLEGVPNSKEILQVLKQDMGISGE